MAVDIGSNCNEKISTFELNILNTKVNFQIDIRENQAKLADIVPLARTICTKICDVVLQNTRSNGDKVPCRKNCSAHCCRYLVPLSIPEALRLKEEISEAPPEKRELIWKGCLTASRHILANKPPKNLTHQSAKASSNEQLDLNLISNWYRGLNLDCPFLYKNACTIYEHRPLACREHYVTSSSSECEKKNADTKLLEMPIYVSNALGRLASELEDTDVEAVILPLVLSWCEENKTRAERTWPYTLMVERLINIIKEMAKENSGVVTI
jgi:Fe-S-cluster containining protein